MWLCWWCRGGSANWRRDLARPICDTRTPCHVGWARLAADVLASKGRQDPVSGLDYRGKKTLPIGSGEGHALPSVMILSGGKALGVVGEHLEVTYLTVLERKLVSQQRS